MKKQLIFLMICAAVVFAIAQTPQLLPYGAKGKFFQVVGSNGDSVQLGNGQRKAIKDIKTDTLSLSHRIDTKLAIVDTANKWLPKSTFLATVAKTGSYDDLTNKPTIPSAQVNADWNASTGIAQILNKPVAMPASDVYDWAKAATKPTYAYSEITNTPSVITPSDTSVFVRKAGTQTITGQKTFSGGLVANGVESSAGGLFYGQWTPFPTGHGTYVANYVSPTYGARILAYNGTAYQDLKLGKLMSGSNFQLHLNADGTSVFNGALTASNLLGTNTGDETLSTIKTKLGVASAANDGYLSRENWSTFNNKQDALGYTPVNSAAVGAANGVAPLDASAKIPTAYLPDAIVGSVKYKGSLNASGGSYPSSPSKGDYYVISAPGTIGSVTYTNGDWAVYNGTTWDAILQGHYVTSVFGRTGAVSAVAGDYTTDQVTEGTNKYYTDSRARSSINNTVQALTYNQGTGVLSQNSGYYYPTTNDQTNWNNKQPALSGIGIVKSTSGTISYLTDNSDAWNTAYSWGNHANAGYAKSSDLGSNAYTSTAYLPLTGGTATGEIVSTSTNSFRMIGGGYGSFWRNDGENTYLMLTNSGDPYGSWNSLFPLSLKNSTGEVVFGQNISTPSIAVTGGSPSPGKVLTATNTSGNCTWQTPTVGTVTSVGLSSSSVGLSATGVVTTSGNLTVNVTSGYAIPTTIALNNAATAYSWGNHASAGYAKSSDLGSNAYTSTPYLPLTGGTATGEIISTSTNSFRMVGGGYGSFWRNDGENTYLMLTNSGDPYGSWNSLFPLSLKNSTGEVVFGQNISTPSISVAGGSPSPGKVLTATNTSGNCTWQTPAVDWANVTSKPTLNTLLPSQDGNSGKVLTTDGSNASWQTPPSYSSFAGEWQCGFSNPSSNINNITLTYGSYQCIYSSLGKYITTAEATGVFQSSNSSSGYFDISLPRPPFDTSNLKCAGTITLSDQYKNTLVYPITILNSSSAHIYFTYLLNNTYTHNYIIRFTYTSQ